MMDDAYAKLAPIFKEIRSNIDNINSEEDSKIQIIIRIIIEVLGWSHSDVGSERKHDNGFSDFLLSENGNPAFVCEAKRIVAIIIDTKEIGQLRHLKLSGPALSKCKDGIQQVASYAAPEGIQISTLTDGISWIIFKTFTPGSNYTSHEAFVFPSLESIEKDFPTFFELLSKSCFAKRLYNPMFDQLHNNRTILSQPLLAPIPDEKIPLLRKSELAFDLDQIFSVFFGRLSGQSDDDMLTECFVESRESRFADLSLEKITANVLGNISPRDKDVDIELKALIESAVDVEAGQTVFIVGPTGSGKSTFLDRFFRKTLAVSIRRKCLVIKVNCLDSTGREDTALQWFTETLIKQFEGSLYASGSPNWDELRGLYYTDYERRKTGVDAKLYERDPQAFKEKFGSFLDEKVENDKEGYLRRIIADVVHNRKMLPIIIVDNTDEFSAEFKKDVFQFSQAIRRTVNHCLIFFPVTDKSAWSFSKTDLYGIYKSKSFFLPTPPPREVFRKRIDFIKSRMGKLRSADEKRSYFMNKGIKLSIDGIENFAAVLEDVFVNHDYTSSTIGELSNYNIRRTLDLSQRVMTSSTLQVEDLFKAFASGGMIGLTHTKFINALLRGDYELFRQSDTHHILPIFQVGDKIRQSPLIFLRILALLDSVRLSARSIDDRHLTIQSILDYFSAMGHNETGLEYAISLMLQSGLLETFDPSVQDLLPSQRLAITFSGQRHLMFGLSDVIYFEQMAITTATTDHDLAARIRSLYRSDIRFTDRMIEIRSAFSKFLIEEDRQHLKVPERGNQYDHQRTITEQIERFGGGKPTEVKVIAKESADQIVAEAVIAIVDMFDYDRGFGFVEIEGYTDQAYINFEKLRNANLDRIFDGDQLLCDISTSAKGMFVTKVHDFESRSDRLEIIDAEVIRIFHDRRYGFVRPADNVRDAFFHFSSLSGLASEDVKVGTKWQCEVSPDKSGTGYQVRRVLTYPNVT